jgi:methyltransferase
MAVLLTMALEALLSSHNERALRARGALEPDDDVIGWMRVAYPLGFILIGIAGATNAALDRERMLWGFALFAAAKALKYWVITSLGARWSFRVLVLPGEPLVATGPYKFARHPNYVAVLGEFAGVALILWAPVTGAVVLAVFAWLLWRRIQVEERALGLARR